MKRTNPICCAHPAPGLAIYQPAHGFRYSAEAYWLVGFALEAGIPATAADLGTGSGIMAALLARQGVQTVGYDVRPEWQPLWKATLAASGAAQGKLSLVLSDIAQGVAGPVELVISNPPFFPKGTGPVANTPWKAAARTESTATLADFIRVGAQALAPDGRLAVALPTTRHNEACGLGEQVGLALRRVVQVGRKRVLLEWGRTTAGPVVRHTLDRNAPRIQHWIRALR